MIRVVFVGAGSVVFTRQLVADLTALADLDSTELVLHDVDEARLAVAEGIALQASARGPARLDVRVETDRRRAVEAADFVVNMVQIGGIEATRRDLEIPARHGVLQTVGDTTGIGGVFRAMRTFPFLSALADDMGELCPDALLLNYTNPMAMNLWWLSVVAPRVRAVGLCHSVYWTARGLSELVGAPFDRVGYRAAGINHQAWLLDWTLDGEDLYPRLRRRIARDPELRRRARVEMLERFGYYPTETSEHSAEYLSWFLRSPEQRERFRIEPLQYLRISEDNVREFEAARDALASGRDLPIEYGAAEYAPQVIHAVATGTPVTIHGNLPNRGLIDNLPPDAVVEVPVRVDGDGLHPVPQGVLPWGPASQNLAQIAVARLAVEAAHMGDPLLLRQAVLLDPNAASSATPEQIWKMCDELAAAHGDLIPAPLRVAAGGRG